MNQRINSRVASWIGSSVEEGEVSINQWRESDSMLRLADTWRQQVTVGADLQRDGAKDHQEHQDHRKYGCIIRELMLGLGGRQRQALLLALPGT
jgi:hypothetical protein